MKPRINNNGTITEFDTEAELNAYIATISPTPNMTDYIKNLEHEALGKDVVRNLYRTLRAQNLSQADEGDLLNRVFPVFCALGDGFIRGARVIASNLTVAGQLTTNRKNYLIARIDEAIAFL